MKIIAVIVSYNGLKWYKKCFDSLLNSSIPIEIVVVDNKSSDNTIEFIKNNYPQIVLIESNINLGFGKANNLGFKYAIDNSADFVFLLNQDAWVYSDTIETLINKMTAYPEYGLLSPIHLSGSEKKLDYNFSEQLSPINCPDFLSDVVVHGIPEDKVYPIKFVNAALWLISKRCLETVGGFDPIFPHYGEDDNYIDRLEYHGFQRGIYPHVFGVHDRENRSLLLSKRQKENRELIRYLIRFGRLQSPLKKLLIKSTLDIFLIFFINLITLSFSDCLINLKTFVSILYLTPRIRRNRNIARIQGLSFLNG